MLVYKSYSCIITRMFTAAKSLPWSFARASLIECQCDYSGFKEPPNLHSLRTFVLAYLVFGSSITRVIDFVMGLRRTNSRFGALIFAALVSVNSGDRICVTANSRFGCRRITRAQLDGYVE